MLIPSLVDDDHDLRAFSVWGSCEPQLWTKGRPTRPMWTGRVLRQIGPALALVLLFILLFVLALVLLFVQILVFILVVRVIVLELLFLLILEKVGQHQSIELG